jgi:trimeric autotransporter adhesin
LLFRLQTSTPAESLITPKPQKNPVGRPRIHPQKTPLSSTTTSIKEKKQQQPVFTPSLMDDSDEENEDEPDVPGKKLKSNTKNNQKSLNSTSSKYNNIMLIKNEQIVSNSSSINSLNSLTLKSKNLSTVTHLNQTLNDSSSVTSVSSPSVAERQQQNPNTQGDVSDRMSKEKQKFFRFSVFNSDRKHVKQISPSCGNNNDNDSHVTSNGSIKSDAVVAGAFDKYKFVSSSDSENEKVCDKKNKMAKGRVVALTKKTNSTNSSTTQLKPSPPTSTSPNHKSILASTATTSNSHTTICDDVDNKNSTTTKKQQTSTKLKQKRTKSKLSSDSSCCTSGSGSSSGSSSSSDNDEGSSTSSTSTTTHTMSKISSNSTKTSLTNKTETINTMNVFAAINSRELMMSQKGSKEKERNSSYCWTSSVPFNEKSQQKKSSSSTTFGDATKSRRNEVWGFAAEAQKSLNIFNTNSDSESRVATTQCLSNFSGTESDCHMSLLSMSSSTKNNNAITRRLSRSNRDAHQLLPSLNHRPKQRTTTLMRNNTIMSSDDDAKQQLTPSKLVRKAVNYKKFDNTSAMNNKKLIMDASLNGAKYGSDDRPVKEPTESTSSSNHDQMSQSSSTHSQPPYNNNSSKNHSDSMSMSGKEHFTLSKFNIKNDGKKQNPI